jgi:hypothetical protein
VQSSLLEPPESQHVQWNGRFANAASNQVQLNSGRQPPKNSHCVQVVELNADIECPDAPCARKLGEDGDKSDAYTPAPPQIGNQNGHVRRVRAGNARILRDANYLAILDGRDRLSLVLVRPEDRLLEPIESDTRGEEAAIEAIRR